MHPQNIETRGASYRSLCIPIFTKSIDISSLTIICLLAFSFCSAEATEYRATIGTILEDFHYEEENRSGDILDKENGTLFGALLDLHVLAGNWHIAGKLYVINGQADYYAYPSTDSELNSKTSESMKGMSVILGLPYRFTEKLSIEFNSGLGLHIWNRDIHSLPGVSGLDEKYTWPYFSLGVRPTYRIASDRNVDLLIMAKHTFDTTLEVDFKNNIYDPVEFDLDNGQGIEFEINWFQAIGQNTSIGFGPYLHLWWFDESESTTLTKDGIRAGVVYEPASHTKNLGVQLFLRKQF